MSKVLEAGDDLNNWQASTQEHERLQLPLSNSTFTREYRNLHVERQACRTHGDLRAWLGGLEPHGGNERLKRFELGAGVFGPEMHRHDVAGLQGSHQRTCFSHTESRHVTDGYEEDIDFSHVLQCLR